MRVTALRLGHDSSGLGALVTAYSSAKSGGASLRLCNLGLRSNELLQITKLYTVFEVSDTEAEALRAMAKRASDHTTKAPLIHGRAMPAATTENVAVCPAVTLREPAAG